MSPIPHRLNKFRVKIQFVTFAGMPSMIYKACLATGTVSQTRYIQVAVCEKLARDLNMRLDDLLVMLPAPRGPATMLLPTKGKPRIGPANTIETVK